MSGYDPTLKLRAQLHVAQMDLKRLSALRSRTEAYVRLEKFYLYLALGISLFANLAAIVALLF